MARPDAGPDCDPSADLDRDGVGDCRDPDANGDGVPDQDTPAGDLDGDGLPDVVDPDLDGDGIFNWDELGPEGMPVDTDGDRTADHRDLDSDGDTIADLQEGLRDFDGDGVPSFRDQDSDGDGISDRLEAGDDDLATPPASCIGEIDDAWEPTADEPPPPLDGDGVADYADPDSDGDGLTDGVEVAAGTDPCGWDSDGDGAADLFEVLVDQLRCLRGDERDCGAAVDGDVVPRDASLVFMSEGEERVRSAWMHFAPAVTSDVRPVVSGLPTSLAFDARAFVAASRPSCMWRGEPQPLPERVCWEPPDGVSPADAVEMVDGERYSQTVPGTRVEFEFLLESFHIAEGDEPQVFGAVLSIPGTDHLFVIRVPAAVDVEG